MTKFVSFLIVALAFTAAPPPIRAQSDRPLELHATAGVAAFPDDGTWGPHAAVGGGVRKFFAAKWSVGAELLYLDGGRGDKDINLVPTLAYHFGNSDAFRPYVVAGAGILWHRGGTTPAFWGSGFSTGGGIGFQIATGRRWFITPEFRIGWEPLMRGTVTFGYRF
jgi:Outer membrane protein beta-barrel domain